MTWVQTIRMAYNNVYLVSGRGARVLIDTGPDYRGAWDELREQVSEPPDVVVVTHGHNDHAGLGRQWQDEGVPVVVQPEDHRMVGEVPLSDAKELVAYEGYLEHSGIPADVGAEALAIMKQRRQRAAEIAAGVEYPEKTREGHWPTGLRNEPYVANAPGEYDEALEQAGLRLIDCPGHTPGNAVVGMNNGMLFSGDQLLPEITPTPGIQMVRSEGGGFQRFRSLPHFAASLRKLAAYEWSLCHPGHGEAFSDVRGRIKECLDGVEQRCERILEVLREHPGATAWDVSSEIYPRVLRRRLWQILATVQGHLDELEEQRAVHVYEGHYEAT